MWAIGSLSYFDWNCFVWYVWEIENWKQNGQWYELYRPNYGWWGDKSLAIKNWPLWNNFLHYEWNFVDWDYEWYWVLYHPNWNIAFDWIFNKCHPVKWKVYYENGNLNFDWLMNHWLPVDWKMYNKDINWQIIFEWKFENWLPSHGTLFYENWKEKYKWDLKFNQFHWYWKYYILTKNSHFLWYNWLFITWEFIEWEIYYPNWRIRFEWECENNNMKKWKMYDRYWNLVYNGEYINWFPSWQWIIIRSEDNISSFINCPTSWAGKAFYKDNNSNKCIWLWYEWEFKNWQPNWYWKLYLKEWFLNYEWEFKNWKFDWKWTEYYITLWSMSPRPWYIWEFKNWTRDWIWKQLDGNWTVIFHWEFKNWKLIKEYN